MQAIKPLFRPRPSLLLRLLLGVVASCGLLAAERHGLLTSFRSALTTAVYPVQRVISAPARFLESVAGSLSSYAVLVAENRRLEKEQLVLKTKQLKFASLEQENIRLRGLLETSFKLGEQMLIAELLSVNLVPYEHIVVVNKGSRYGVHQGQPVFDANGVVGQIIRVAPNSAEAMLITDPNHAIPVQVNRNGLRTVALGTGQIDRLVLPYLSGSADIKPGDLLLTSGLGGVFPQGYPVATVTGIAGQGGTFAKVMATPQAQLDRVREVLLVWSNSEPLPRIPEHSGAPLESAAGVGRHDGR